MGTVDRGRGICKDLQATAWIDVTRTHSATFAQGVFTNEDGTRQFAQERSCSYD